MTDLYSSVVPPAVLQKLRSTAPTSGWHRDAWIAEQAAQYGADQELEACCVEVSFWGSKGMAKKLRAARRPKPPSLKEQALIHFESFAATFETSGGDSDLIRRALEQLND